MTYPARTNQCATMMPSSWPPPARRDPPKELCTPTLHCGRRHSQPARLWAVEPNLIGLPVCRWPTSAASASSHVRGTRARDSPFSTDSTRKLSATPRQHTFLSCRLRFNESTPRAFHASSSAGPNRRRIFRQTSPPHMDSPNHVGAWCTTANRSRASTWPSATKVRSCFADRC